MSYLPPSLTSKIEGKILYNEPMKNHTTWRIGGPAEVLVEPASRKDIALLLKFAKEGGQPLTVIGNGSNLLVGDSGIKGVVIKIGDALGRVRIVEEKLIAEAGAKLGRVTAIAQAAGLGGLEFAVGIPATIGGAVTMNAGANGVSMADVVDTVTVIDYDVRERVFGVEELGFGYRTSRLQQLPAIVVEIVLRLTRQDPIEIRRRGEEFLRRRRITQPLEYQSAGSVFKNPPGDAAGRLIELAGAKGLRIGDAMVSEKHANFIVNLGNAQARDVLLLIERVREMVQEKFGIQLELEVKVFGNSGAG
ncbi:MAG: UDP-N-acetylmuramate dehydrogenase [Firmicutes bacterium]|nr:UDP-N-acetylmuramate dehydrogenase [Bacillota bacterium]